MLTSDRDSVGNEWSILNRDFEYFKDFSKQLEVILRNEEEIDVLERKEQIYNSLIYSFGPKGLIVSRLDIICKYLTEKANFYISRILKEDVRLQFLMDDASLDLNITFKGKERGVANLSGGENGKIGLACMLGLRSLLPAEYQTNLLILDEPEANWDDRVRHELVNMLESLLSSTNLDSIFMISHSTSVQDLQVWDTRLHCVKENGISSLEIRTR
jgi:DNA repair exonuclease SbcCD ATPase subunit